MKIIFCDDDKTFLKMVMSIMQKYESLYKAEMEGFSDGNSLMEYCRNNLFDIVYMDIEIGMSNGMDMARVLKMINPKALIIYMSAYSTYFGDMVNAEPFRFVPKDCSDINKLEKELANALEAAVKRIEGRDTWVYFYRRQQYNVELAKIKYFYSFARKIYIVSDTEQSQNFYYGRLDDVEKDLKNRDERFARINKKVIVNMVNTGSKGKNKVKINNKVFTVTPPYQEEFNKRYKKYWKVYL